MLKKDETDKKIKEWKKSYNIGAVYGNTVWFCHKNASSKSYFTSAFFLNYDVILSECLVMLYGGHNGFYYVLIISLLYFRSFTVCFIQ